MAVGAVQSSLSRGTVVEWADMRYVKASLIPCSDRSSQTRVRMAQDSLLAAGRAAAAAKRKN